MRTTVTLDDDLVAKAIALTGCHERGPLLRSALNALINGDQLVMLLMEHGIGVHRSAPDLFEIDEEF